MTSAVPLSRSDRQSAPAMRSITILGATGSIGTSTIDLIKRNRGRYRVVAVTAARNAAALARLARDLNASFAAGPDPACFHQLQSGARGPRLERSGGRDPGVNGGLRAPACAV